MNLRQAALISGIALLHSSVNHGLFGWYEEGGTGGAN
jgi:hypothetical protein